MKLLISIYFCMITKNDIFLTLEKYIIFWLSVQGAQSYLSISVGQFVFYCITTF